MTQPSRRSTNARHFQGLAQSIGVMAKSFDDGFVIAQHDHERDQLLYAKSGIMRLRTDHQAWIVPPDVAVYIPAGIGHSVSMQGSVDMRTLYIDATKIQKPAQTLSVVAISGLLRALILALSEEPVDYDIKGRGGLMAQLIEMEINNAPDLSLNIPLPKDARLQRVCGALLADPADRRTLDGWSHVAGASTRTLARLFELDLGMSFSHWRRRVRFHSALEALARGTAVAIVAGRHGYRSTSAFSAAFRSEMGASPSRISAEP